MAISTGAVSMSAVNSELGRPYNQVIDMNDGAVRALAQVGGSGTSWNLLALRGKSAYTPMSVTPHGIYDEQTAPGVQYFQGWNPSVDVSGGSGGYSYSWSFTSNPYSFTLTAGTETGQFCQIKHSISKFGFAGDATMNCQITDNTGHVVNVSVPIHVNYTDPNAG